MAWMRAVAGANLITSFRVIYQLVGLTTTGASSATAYAPFSFSLVGAAARIPPATINIYSDGLLLAVGTDYSYNSTTGAVTIYRVAGDIIVEAVGKVATIIYSPAAGYNYFAVMHIKESIDGLADGYYICWWNWSSAPQSEWKPATGGAGWVPISNYGVMTAYINIGKYSQRFAGADAAVSALYIQGGASYVSGNIRVADARFSQLSPASTTTNAPREIPYSNFATTWYSLASIVGQYVPPNQAKATLNYAGPYNAPEQVIYDAIRVQ